MQEWMTKQIDEFDWSKGDYAVACRMIIDGYNVSTISNAIAENSPNISERKLNHVNDYAERTALNAAKNSEVLKKLKEKNQHLNLNNGISR